ncbi:DUF1996 domain-containing protein [Actinomadura sp. NPDC000600]|uniref:DUF1996 domain-containing protein n=1 Tax=Actinomadura sp. NPDC000600 TaxID=3154262 RepID=UPI0033950233
MQRSVRARRKKRSIAFLAFGAGFTMVATGVAGCGRSADTSLSSADGAAPQSVSCPAVKPRLPRVPASQQAEVARELALLDSQIAEANRRLKSLPERGGRQLAVNAVLKPLEDKRAAALDRIAISFQRAGQQPPALGALARCRLTGGGQGGGSGQDGGGQGGAGAGNGVVGPAAADFIDIRKVRPVRTKVRPNRKASRGSFTSRCGTDKEKHQNTDNIIISPGVPNGAEHLHDYVGNLSTDAFSTDASLAAAGTSCRIKAEKSTYFWPVLRVRRQGDAGKGAAEKDKNNVGTAVLPSKVILRYSGSPRGKVTAMPRFLRLFTGDAKAFSKGPANAQATWTCTGFTDRRTDKYPLCPKGSDVVRFFDEPSCWDGKNTDSANHRAHAVFPEDDGRCPAGFKAIPHLTMALVYKGIPNTTPKNDGDVRFAVDGFATEQHKPITDHAGYINVMSKRLNAAVAKCVNRNRRC